MMTLKNVIQMFAYPNIWLFIQKNIVPCDGDRVGAGERWDEEQKFHGDLIKECTAQFSPHS